MTAGETAPDLPPRQRRLLDAVAWANRYLDRPAVPRSIVAWIAETTAASSTFERDCGRLRTLGLVDYPAPGTLMLTAEGIDRALRLPKPATLQALWGGISARLPPRQIEIVEALMRDTRDHDRDLLARKAGTVATSSTFERDLGRLRTLGLIVYPTPGQVALAELLK